MCNRDDSGHRSWLMTLEKGGDCGTIWGRGLGELELVCLAEWETGMKTDLTRRGFLKGLGVGVSCAMQPGAL